jgi:site-specific recombinase
MGAATKVATKSQQRRRYISMAAAELRATTTRRDRVILVAVPVKMIARVVTQSKQPEFEHGSKHDACSAKLKLKCAGLLSVEATSQCGMATATPRRSVLHPGK